MPRVARQSSESGIYHVMFRGINGENIFTDVEDRLRFLTTLERFLPRASSKLFGFCLMPNHVHLLVSEGEEPLGTTMKRIGVSYVHWYNHKYLRSGHLFQDRYLSLPVETDENFLAVLRYIHQNSLVAGLVTSCAAERWSSYRYYLGETVDCPGLVSTQMALNMHGNWQRFAAFTESPGQMSIDIPSQGKRISDAELCNELTRLLRGRQPNALRYEVASERARILRELKALGASLRQIARVTGLGKSTLGNARKHG